jgi:hypothetical protein
LYLSENKIGDEMGSDSTWATKLELLSESDVEQKFIARLLVENHPFGLGYQK